MKRKSRILALLMACALLIMSIPFENIHAVSDYTITYIYPDGTVFNSANYSAGETLGSLPSVSNLVTFINNDNGEPVTDSTVVDSNMSITAIATDHITSQGTLDSGNVTWYLCGTKLYVLGTGTIAIANRASTNATKAYGLQLNSIELLSPSIESSWITPTSTGNNLSDGFGSFTNGSATYDYNLNVSRPFAFTGQTISYPATALADAAPWLANASDITTMLFADTVSLSGNFTLYFNQNSAEVSPSAIKDSVYSKLETIYLYADMSGVTRASGMFARCAALQNIYIKEGSVYDATNCLDMSAMFYGDTLLGNSDTAHNYSLINHITNLSNVEDMRYFAFGCSSLVKPSISSWNVSSVKDFSYAFTGCNSLGLTCSNSGDAWDIYAWDMSNAFSTVGMFAGAQIDMSLENPTVDLWGETTSSVVTGSFDISALNLVNNQVSVYMFAQNASLTDIKWTGSVSSLSDASCMFAWTPNLVNVEFENLSTPNLKYTDAMFYKSGSNAVANMKNWDLSAVEDARFMYCESGFSSIDLDGTNMSSLVLATGMYKNCTQLISLGLNGLSDWILNNVKDASYMFEGDSKLTKLETGSWGMENVENLSHFADGTSSLAELSPTWNITKVTSIDCFLKDSGVSSLNLSLWNFASISSAFYAFEGMQNLTAIDFGTPAFDSLENAYGMFANDSNLSSLDLNGVEAPVLTNAAGMLYNCSALSDVAISSLLTSPTDISFFACDASSITELDISGWNTTQTEYLQAAFKGMTSLTSLTIGDNFKTDSAKSISEIYKNDGNLSDMFLQDFAAKINSNSLEDTSEAFAGCNNLSSVDLSNTDFSNVKNISKMFYEDSSLSTITLPSNFGQGVPDMAIGGVSIFYVPKTKLTYLTITSDSIPSVLSSYDWKSDKRKFIYENASTINGVSTTSYIFPANAAEPVELKYDVVSTLYLNSKAADINYSWSYDDGSGSASLLETSNNLSVGTSQVGDYTVSATIKDLVDSPSLSSVFSIRGAIPVVGITAAYVGEDVPVGEDYSKSDVTVYLKFSDGTTSSSPLSTVDFSVDSQTVLSSGENTFKVTYTDGVSDFTDTITVTGVVAPVSISGIEASYTGKNIVVGKKYSKDDVKVIIHYSDGTDQVITANDFEVDSQTVSSAGDNTFTVTYNDGVSNFTDTFTVFGLLEVVSISAKYEGPDMYTGKDYSIKDVILTLTYSDSSTAVTTDFTVDSTTVKVAGANSFFAVYKASEGKELTSSFVVTGIAPKVTEITAAYVGSPIFIGNNYDKANVTVVAKYDSGDAKTLSADQFTVNSTQVTKKGENQFTASYKDGKTTYTSVFSVTGKRVIGSIEVVYSGPNVAVGSAFNSAYITCTAYYADDTYKAEGFQVTPTSFSNTIVTLSGANSFVASYKDHDNNGNELTDTFTVTGYKALSVVSIDADYYGAPVEVGQKYNKNDVIVTVHYTDKTKDTMTSSFTLNSQLVNSDGNNSFTASYIDDYGNTFTDSFIVSGVRTINTSGNYDEVTTDLPGNTSDYSDDGSGNSDDSILFDDNTNNIVPTDDGSSGGNENTDPWNDSNYPDTSSQNIGVPTGDVVDMRGLFISVAGLISLLAILLYERKKIK